MKTLVVVPCGKSKVWKKDPNAGPTEAKNVYTGSPFKVNREYAETFSDKWVILSAKYGFMDNDFIIPRDYNVTFNDPKTNPIAASTLKRQAKNRFFEYDCIVALGGRTYANLVVDVFKDTGKKVITPTAGLPIGKSLGKVKNAVRTNKPFTCS